MTFDLRSALLRKAEIETARLVDFAFRRRARSMRLLAARLGREPAALVSRIAHADDAAILADLARETGLSPEAVTAAYRESVAAAHAALVAERGDPAPHRLA